MAATEGEHAIRCPVCGEELRPTARFCASCGQPVNRAAPVPAPRAYTRPHLAEKIIAGGRRLDGEHKQVTVLFADARGSMDLSETLDPERWHTIMDRFFTLLCEGVQRFEGTVAKFTGDGIMALFGAPIAHEDHARRASLSALHLKGELARYADELRREEGLDFSVRIGLNSGEVVLGSIGADLHVDYTAVGHTVGLAQRMEGLSEPGKVYLSEHTAKLVSGYFRLRDLGEFEVKGVREPLRVHELVGAGQARTPFEFSRARGLSRLVGREQELATLGAALEQSLAGDGQVVGIVGDPGVGKSRLAFELAERCRAQEVPVYEAHAMAHGKSVPFLPVLEMLRGYFGVEEKDPEATAREKVSRTVLALDQAFDPDLPLLLDFLGAADPKRPPPHMDPEARQRRLLELVVRLVQAHGRTRPAVDVVEDLHWLDPASEPFVQALIEAVAGEPVLVVATFRPDYEAEWMRASHCRALQLRPLDETATAELVRELLGPDPSLDGLAELIGERTGGNAFFIEEVVQALVESGSLEGEKGAYRLARSIEEVTVPATVQAVLASRIDRLADRDKALLQTASVIGKRFPKAVLSQVTGSSEGDLDEALRALVVGELVYEETPEPDSDYAFEHPLTQEVAYRSQLGDRRGRTHGAVARALTDLYAEALDERAALIAQHWEAAGELAEAAKWSARAAEWAGVNDPGEANRHWRKVLSVAGQVEDSEAAALAMTARIWILEFGWRVGMPEVEATAVLDDGIEAAERNGDPASVAMLLAPYATLMAAHGDLERCIELNFEARRRGDESRELPARMVGRAGLVYALMLTGRLAEGLAICREAIDLTEGDPTIPVSVDWPSALAFFVPFQALFLAPLGRLKEASEASDAGIRIARERGTPELLCFAHNMSVWPARYLHDGDLALERARLAIELGEEIGGAHPLVWSYSCLGLAHVLRGEWSDAIAACEHSVALAHGRTTGVEWVPLTLAHLAEARLGSGDAAAARATGEQAVEIARGVGLRAFEAVAQRALARVLLHPGDAREHDAVEAALKRALELALEMDARGEEALIRVEIAELERIRGDEGGRERELRAAERLFLEIGARSQAARIAERSGATAPRS